MFYSNTDLKATLSNNTGLLLTAKYKWQALTVYGGYAWLRQADPERRLSEWLHDHRRLERSCDDPLDLPRRAKFWPTQWTSYTTYAIPRIAPFFWVGAKYAITPQLDVTGAFYYLQQSDYNTTACTGALTTFVATKRQ